MSNRFTRLPLSLVFSLFWLALLTSSGCRRPVSTGESGGKATRANLSEAIDWADKRRQGIDFVAMGTAPAATTIGWRLDIDFSKQMLFQSFDGPQLLTPIPKPQPMGKTMGVVLDAKATPVYASNTRRTAASRNAAPKVARLKVYIEPIACRDPVSKRDYAYTVRIDANGKRFTGCGAFIKGSDRLNGAWVLETFKGQRLRPDQFGDKQLPYLEIDLAGHKLVGSTGWNKIKGAIDAEGDHLDLVPKTTTRRTAPGTFETDFLTALDQSSLFRIGKDRLTLLVNGQYAMTFRKK
ncbi:META domain-containing protein [Rudanella paleaurantiibacter]|uniref:META domain-containing protein n=1 Tax=Rudanella paleaurantiibacter TaxID=2614655 RepID=A0A7J5U6G1_9BACT|nr:META domain-containing protein [Rudanella paleaurantiibacter]KAB7732740.1 META domain-containing protein [Rudanella paleaurantiibacter]